MAELAPCPFCGGRIKIVERKLSIVNVHTKAECMRCGMLFEYGQDFAYSKKARVAINEPFETMWNRRAEDGK